MPPKARATSAKAPAASNDVASTSSAPPIGPKSAAAAAKKRARQVSQSSQESERDATHKIFLVGFTIAEMDKYDGLMTNPWSIVERIQGSANQPLSDSVTHLVIKSMTAIKHSQQLLPIYYAVLKGIPLLRQSFLPCSSGRRKSLGGLKALEDEKKHAYDGKEIDAAATAKSNFPSIMDIVRLRSVVEDLKEDGKMILDAEPFQKVIILAGRTKDSKQRKEELKMVMEAGGATVLEDTVFKTWKAKRKKGGDIETPSMVLIVNGETNVSATGLDDESIRDLLKARAPVFYEEFISTIFLYSQHVSRLDDMLLQSFVFIHEQMPNVDSDGRLQKLVMGDDDDDVGVPPIGEKTPSGRRLNSRASSSARESSSSEQIGKEKKKGMRERKKEEEMKETRKEEEEEDEKVNPSKKAKAPKKKDGEVSTEVKKGRGRPRKHEQKEEEDEDMEMEEEEAIKEPKKEVKKGRTKKEEKKEKKTKKKGKEEMEDDDVDPALADGNLDLLEEFEKEIEEGKGRRNKRTEKEMEELRAMREDRGDDDGEEMEEQPVTPEPILFSQVPSQPEIEIPEELRRALEGAIEEDEDMAIKTEDDDEEGDAESQKSLSSTGRLIIDESDDGSMTLVGEDADDIADMEALREEMNDEMRGGVKKEEDDRDEDRSDTPMGDQPASEFGLKSVAASARDDAKECETCNPMGMQHLYFNQQLVEDIEAHFNAPRLEWHDHIIEIKQKMPWIKEGTAMRPACGLETRPMIRSTIDLFFSFYHELDEDAKDSALLDEINSSDAMEMYEADYEEHMWRRPPLDLMIKMLHEFSVKRHSEDLLVPERACFALKNAIPVILPSSSYGRHFWLTVLAGGSNGIKGRATQVMEEMAKRCKTFFTKALFNGFYPISVVDFIVYYCEVDLFCAMTPVVEYEEGDEETTSSQRTNKMKKSRKKKNPLDGFPLVLLMVMELDEEPRRGLSESAILVVQKLLESSIGLRRASEWEVASILERALLCLLEAARWHCGKAASSALTGAERRRVKAAESASQGKQEGKEEEKTGSKCTMELQQNVQRVVKMALKKGVKMSEIRDTLTIAWLEDIVKEM